MQKDIHPKIAEMLEAGAHFGYSKTRRHPTVKKFVFTTKNGVDYINLEKTVELLESAEEFVKTFAQGDKQILFVGTKPEARKAILEAAESIDMPHVTQRWVGGTITNDTEIKKRVKLLQDLESQKEKGELEKYTKKERLLIDEKIAKMTRLFAGLIPLRKMPDALIVIDTKDEDIAVTEARKAGIPIIGLLNTDTKLSSADYPIVGNDGSVSSISLFVNALVEAYKSGKAISK